MKNSVSFDLKYSNAGTSLVPEDSGNKAIESIEIGDKVWAYNEETGDNELKEGKRINCDVKKASQHRKRIYQH